MTAAALDSAVNLLLEGQWNPEVDPLPAEEWPSETRYVTAYTSTGAPKTTQITSTWKSLAPWSWIVVGVGIVMVIFGAKKRKK